MSSDHEGWSLIKTARGVRKRKSLKGGVFQQIQGLDRYVQPAHVNLSGLKKKTKRLGL